MGRRSLVLILTGLLFVTVVLHWTFKPVPHGPVKTRVTKSSETEQRVFQLPNIWYGQTSGELASARKEILLIPGDEELRQMDLFHLQELWMNYVENIQEACGFQYHNGAEGDGGYTVCERYIARNNCLVYSFGSRRLYSFEDDVIKNYGCEIHTFDPYDKQEDHQHSPNCTFHSWGITPTDIEERKLYRLTTIKKRLNHSERILDILKIDIESAEWAALPEIIASGELNRVKLLIIEFHLNHKHLRTVEKYLSRLAVLRDMYDMGFRLYYFRRWTACQMMDESKKVRTSCHEVHFMKVN